MATSIVTFFCIYATMQFDQHVLPSFGNIFFRNLLVVARLESLVSIKTEEYFIWPPPLLTFKVLVDQLAFCVVMLIEVSYFRLSCHQVRGPSPQDPNVLTDDLLTPCSPGNKALVIMTFLAKLSRCKVFKKFTSVGKDVSTFFYLFFMQSVSA